MYSAHRSQSSMRLRESIDTDDQPAPHAPSYCEGPKLARQWVHEVTAFSSEYDKHDGWSADMMIGPPRVYPNYGDIKGAWAPREILTDQFVELHFKEAVYITEIHIYETYHAGATKRVLAKSRDSRGWITLYETSDIQVLKTSRIFTPPMKKLNYKCADIRIEIDCTAAKTWVEIDAVEIVGKRFNVPELGPTLELVTDLGKMVNNQTHSDVTLKVAGKDVYGHKAILSARSDYFRILFSTETGMAGAKKPLDILGVSYDGFLGVLHYLYTCQIPPTYTCQQLVDVIREADTFTVKGIKELATKHICERLDPDNVIYVYLAASDLPVLDGIQTCCLEYMKANIADISKHPSFETLAKEEMLKIVQHTSQLRINDD